MKDIRMYLYEDLENMICALDIYLSEFVEKIKVNKLPLFEQIKPDFVLTFNYTNTYERAYNSNIDIHHIHGKIADINNKGNIVLGIDEYLDKKDQTNKVNYAIFKKFVQRIRNKTGNDYRQVLNDIEKIYKKNGTKYSGICDLNKDYPDGISRVYIFGHSLDITDKDILANFIKSDATDVEVYCHDKASEGMAIENIIRLTDEDTLVEKYLSNPTKMKFEIIRK